MNNINDNYRSNRKYTERVRKKVSSIVSEHGADYESEEQKVIQELQENDCDVTSIIEYRYFEDYLTDVEVSILTKWLKQTSHNMVKAAIVSAFHQKKGKIDGNLLTIIFDDPSSDNDLRWTIANLSVRSVKYPL